VQAAALELKWKQREADLLMQAEETRLEVDRAAASERLDLRRAVDDEPLAGEVHDHDAGQDE
jgi:hypothetical protein